MVREQILGHHNRTLPQLAVGGPRIAAVRAAEIAVDPAAVSR